jgi:hypothetical protein
MTKAKMAVVDEKRTKNGISECMVRRLDASEK